LSVITSIRKQQTNSKQTASKQKIISK